MNKIRILIVDDHPMMRKGLMATLQAEPDMEVTGAAASGRQAIEFFREQRPDLAIMDITLTEEMTGIEATQAIRREFPDARIIMFSAYQGDENIYRALQAGAVTYLLKETLGDELVRVLREVHAGGRPIPQPVAKTLADRLTQQPLTPREIDVLKLMAEGLRNKEISGRLAISQQTTQGHIRNILSKLGVHDRTEAVTVGIKRGIIHINT